MFTVVIAEKEHLDSIQEYRTYFLPFLKEENIAFCQWDTMESDFHDAVSGLSAAVGMHQQWRAVILCDEAGLKKKNPFELATYSKPKRDAYTKAEDYLAEVRARKFEAYQKAAQNPLTRLVTCLCEWPLAAADGAIQIDDPEYDEYLAEITACTDCP